MYKVTKYTERERERERESYESFCYILNTTNTMSQLDHLMSVLRGMDTMPRDKRKVCGLMQVF